MKKLLIPIPIKFLELNGRLVPLIGGGSEGQEGNQGGTTTTQPEPTNIQEIVQKELDKRAQELGFESWDDLQAQHLERQGKLEELLEKTKEKYTKELEQTRKEAQTYKQLYEETVKKVEITTKASQLGAIDPELVYELVSKKAVVKDGKVEIDGKPVDEALKELFEKKPYLVKASEKEGSGAEHETKVKDVENLPPQERLKLAFKKFKKI